MRIKNNFSVSMLMLIQITGLFAVKQLSGCDTWIAMKDASHCKVIMLAKNSDRTGTESQPLVLIRQQKWPEGSIIDLGRLMIPQVPVTYATLGSGPYWCWGYEEGMNAFGVSIGNQGVFTRPLAAALEDEQQGIRQPRGLTGMDMVRLGLERGKTAREALTVITSLLKKHGQFGTGIPGMDAEGSYDNSFIIADPSEAWILETAGRQWAARKIRTQTASISNTLSLKDSLDLQSEALITYAVEKGWHQNEPFNFRRAYRTPSLKYTADRRAQIRADRSLELLKEKEGYIDLRWMMRIARDRATEPSIDMDITASSSISVLADTAYALPVFWWTPVSPGIGCYVPFFVHSGKLPEIVSRAGTAGKNVSAPSVAPPDSFNQESYWWLFHDLAGRVNQDRSARHALVRTAFDSLEVIFELELPDVLSIAKKLRENGAPNQAASLLEAYTDSCVTRVLNIVQAFRDAFKPVLLSEQECKYLGEYVLKLDNENSRKLTVLEKDGCLALDVPGQMVFALKPPDLNGRREFVLTSIAAVTFTHDSSAIVTGLNLHQSTPLPWSQLPGTLIFPEVDSLYSGYWGSYKVPVQNISFFVLPHSSGLLLRTPDHEELILTPSADDDHWKNADKMNFSVSFQSNQQGAIESMWLHQAIPFRKQN